VKRDRVEYWHVELDAHDILLAEGLPAESYLDCGNRTAFANGGAFVEAHPDFLPKHWRETCLPLVKEGPLVARTKARLIGRLLEEGFEIAHEPDAHLVVDGRRVEPSRSSQTRLTFDLPQSARQVTLKSLTFVPAHTVAESTDLRALGLCVSNIQFDGEAIALDDDAQCASGWHAAELSGGRFAHRWTTGATQLPAGARTIVIDLAGEGYYWRQPTNRRVAMFA
jgi:hypothetical protein